MNVYDLNLFIHHDGTPSSYGLLASRDTNIRLSDKMGQMPSPMTKH